MTNATDYALKCVAVFPDPENSKAAVVYFSRPLTDDELLFFEDVCQRAAPLMLWASESGKHHD